MEIKCQFCNQFIPQKTYGRKKHICDACQVKRKAEYYAQWYAKNGRNRSGGNSVYLMEWRKQNPEKVAAHKAVAGALKGGRLKNPGICFDCNHQTTYLDAHHTDYTKPLDVVWLCIKCHRKRHNISG